MAIHCLHIRIEGECLDVKGKKDALRFVCIILISVRKYFALTPSSPWMEPLVDGFQAACVYVGVNLSGGNVGMAQHHLYGAKISSP